MVEGGRVYFTSSATVYALDAVSGELRWQAKPGAGANSSPAAEDGIVFVGGGENDVYALDGASGEEIWRFTTNGTIETTPAVAEGVVYVNTYSYSYDGDGRLYALDAASGEQLWSSGVSGMDWAPVVVDGVVYVSGYSGLYAFDAASGEPLPNFPVRPGDESALAVAHGVVYAGELYALDGASGEVLWVYSIEEDYDGPSFAMPPAVADGVVYAGASDGKVYALAAAESPSQAARPADTDGQAAYAAAAPLWRFRTGDSVDSSAVVIDGVVYIGSGDSYFYALNEADGEMLWRYRTGARVTTTAEVFDGVVYFGSADGYLYALDAASGNMLWRKLTGLEVYSSPAVLEGVVYFGSADGHLYALDTADGKERWAFPDRRTGAVIAERRGGSGLCRLWGIQSRDGTFRRRLHLRAGRGHRPTAMGI